ncbi:MAG TPA: hypothetical protein VEA60_05455 [Allosphingosinicella sp.]|nr:hypothetical protein [Allosphingosinicella sp.]
MGSSGSGAGGSGGRGFDGGGPGSVTLKRGKLTVTDPGRQKAWASIQTVYSKIAPESFGFAFGEPGVVRAYEALFGLHVMLVQERSWQKVEQRYGVDGGSGCLSRLADVLSPDHGEAAIHPNLQAPLRKALLDFFLRIVGDDPAVRNRGDAQQVIAAVDPEVFQRTSNHFLAAYLREHLRQEGANLSPAARRHVQEFAAAKADRIVGAFEKQFRGKAWQEVPQASYAHLLRIMGGERDWTVRRLRTALKP